MRRPEHRPGGFGDGVVGVRAHGGCRHQLRCREGVPLGGGRASAVAVPGHPLSTAGAPVGGLPDQKVTFGDHPKHPAFLVEGRQAADVVLGEKLGDVLERRRR